MKELISTTLIRCPGCKRTVEGPNPKPLGFYNGRCRQCGTIFTYQVAFVSPPLIVQQETKQEPEREIPEQLVKPSAWKKCNDSTVDMDSSDSGTDWESAIEQCDSILEQCDEIPERGEEFADSIREKVGSIRDWVEENETVTPAQLQALENMADGVGRWIN